MSTVPASFGLIEEWAAAELTPRCSAATVAARTAAMRRLARLLGDRPPIEASPDDVEAWLERQSTSPAKDAAEQLGVKVARVHEAMFKARDRGIFSYSPGRGKTGGSLTPKGRALLEAAGPDVAHIVQRTTNERPTDKARAALTASDHERER